MSSSAVPLRLPEAIVRKPATTRDVYSSSNEPNILPAAVGSFINDFTAGRSICDLVESVKFSTVCSNATRANGHGCVMA